MDVRSFNGAISLIALSALGVLWSPSMARAGGDEQQVRGFVDGDTAMLAAFAEGGDGTAFVFERTDCGFSQVDALKASDGQPGDSFGYIIAIDGERAVISALSDDRIGSAYVFERVGGIWTEVQKLVPSDGARDDLFGNALDICGDTIVIGSNLNDEFGNAAGKAYVFELIGGVWTETQKLASGNEFDFFGSAVALNEDTLMIGAPSHLVNGQRAGATFVFEKIAGIWTVTQRIDDPEASGFEDFGGRLDLDGDVAVIADRGQPGGGKMYVYENVNGTWTRVADLRGSDTDVFDAFGVSVGISEERIIVGADNDERDSGLGGRGGGGGGGLPDVGSAYLFEKVNGTWMETAKFEPWKGTRSQFGFWVDISSQTVVVAQIWDAPSGDAPLDALHILGLGFESFGVGCPGSGGFAPELTGKGATLPGGLVEIELSQGLGGALGTWLIGGCRASVPMGGGCTLLVAPPFTLFPMTLSPGGPGEGTVTLSSLVPPDARGLNIVLQAFVFDPANPIVNSNGIAFDVE